MLECTGCDGPLAEAESWGEHLATPLGRTYVRYHRDRACVQQGRERLDGRHVDPAPGEYDRLLEAMRARADA